MTNLTLSRASVAALFVIAALAAAAFMPAEGDASAPCDDMDCRTFPANACQPQDGSYCHAYDWDCWDGSCQQT